MSCLGMSAPPPTSDVWLRRSELTLRAMNRHACSRHAGDRCTHLGDARLPPTIGWACAHKSPQQCPLLDEPDTQPSHRTAESDPNACMGVLRKPARDDFMNAAQAIPTVILIRWESLRIEPSSFTGHPPNSDMPPGLDSNQQGAMVVCKLVSAIRPQKL
jgi:hypothetical protein